MICTQCKTRNPIGNKFCRECGGKLSAPEGTLAAEEIARVDEERRQEAVARLLADAFALSEKGEPEKAIPLAEEAVALIPQATSAHALLAVLYERTDQDKKAIAAQERVVELSPESGADRAKLEQMRRGVHVLPRRAPNPTTAAQGKSFGSWVPAALAGGVAAVVLIVGVAAINTPASKGKRKAPSTQPVTVAAPTVTPETTVPTPPATAPTLPSTTVTDTTAFHAPPPAPTQTRSDPFAHLSGSPSAPAVSNNTRASVGGGLPRFTPPASAFPANSGGSTGNSLPPVGNTVSTPEAPEPVARGNGFGGSARLSVGPPPTSDSTNPVSNSDERGDAGSSYIHIQAGPPTTRTTVSPPPATPTQNPLQRAQSLQSAGRYKEAVSAYQQAINAGSDNAEVYQSLALSQQRVGDTSGARSSYQRAIAAYEAQGKGGASQRGIASCRAALDLLGG